MKLKSLKILKKEATKKVKTGTTKVPKSRTSSKRTTSPTWFTRVRASNLKDTWTTLDEESWSVCGEATQNWTLEYSSVKTNRSGEEAGYRMLIGPQGLALCRQWDDPSRTIGWEKLLKLIEENDDEG